MDKTLDETLIIPVQAIMGTAATGKKRYCYVKTLSGYEEREIQVGASNEKEAEVRSGLVEGEEVVLNYKVLEDERINAKKPSLSERTTGTDERGTDWGSGPSPTTEIEKANKALGQPAGAGKQDRKGGAGKQKAGRGRGGPGGFEMTPEMQKQFQEFNDKMKKGTPAQRKELLETLPEQVRESVKERLKAQGLEIAD